MWYCCLFVVVFGASTIFVNFAGALVCTLANKAKETNNQKQAISLGGYNYLKSFDYFQDKGESSPLVAKLGAVCTYCVQLCLSI